MAAQFVTPDAINFMATHGRGLICLTLTEEQVDRLELPMMQSPGRSGPPLGTAFTVSIEARRGVTTGISAADRAHTMRVAASPSASRTTSSRRATSSRSARASGGVLVRTGQTEGSVDLARLADLTAGGRHLRDHERRRHHGADARPRALRAEARPRILTIADLIQYRLLTERLVRRGSESTR